MTGSRIFLKKGEENEIRKGFPWVFDNEIAFVKARQDGKILQTELKDCATPDGEVVEVYTKGGLCLGAGVLNKKSKISVRLLTRRMTKNGAADFDDEFFENRVLRAAKLRELFFRREDSCRLVFAEADFLPGFVADKFFSKSGKTVVCVQFLTLGAEVFREKILNALKKVCAPDAIFERSDVPTRELEGLSLQKGWILQGGIPSPRILIEENGVSLEVDLENGQKTGYFLDQKRNRAAVAALAQGKKVLDAFSYAGGFALNAFKGGAKSVLAADISQDAIDLISRNIAANGAQKCVKTRCGDVFDILREFEAADEKFDMIILDPPAFTKSAKMISKAFGGYKEINLRAMRILNEGGILVSCSCSHFFDEPTFCRMLSEAALDAKKNLQILQKSGAAQDHPVLAGYDRSEYLCCAVCRVTQD